MQVLRTPEERFTDLPDYPFDSHYYQVGDIRMHYLDEGRGTADPVLLLHGEPSWSFLYRKMIPALVDAGHRVVVPDLVGFGKSDKPTSVSDYTYQRHVEWTRALVLDGLKLSNVTLVGQDWGGLIGLRLVAEHPDRFARVVAANTDLPTGDGPMSEAFVKWQRYSQDVPELPIGRIVQGGTLTVLPDAVVAAYEAPFPDESYKAGARVFPALVPTRSDDPAREANRAAWSVLANWQKPFLTAFSDGDPITAPAEPAFRQRIPGARNQPHLTIKGAGHFLQEDRPLELAQAVMEFAGR